MAPADSISNRNLTVLAVVVACFAVLWPKIFYPMVESILFPNDEYIQDSIRKLSSDDVLHPQMMESMGEARPPEKLIKEGNQGSFHPYLRQATKPQSKSVGAVNLVIPVYTIAIILFFLYSLLKMAIKRYDEAFSAEKSLSTQCPNAFCAKKYSERKEVVINSRKEILQERKAQRALELYGKDKVLNALKTIILEMEDIKGNISETSIKSKLSSNISGNFIECQTHEEF